MWHQKHPASSHTDDPNLVADCASSRAVTGKPYTHVFQPEGPNQEQWQGTARESMKNPLLSSDSCKCPSLYDSSRTDSGFLSDANLVTDSGLLSDTCLSDEIGSPTRKDPEEAKRVPEPLMRLDSGVDVGLNEELGGLIITDDSWNDLNTSGSRSSYGRDSNIRTSSETVTEPSQPKSESLGRAWELYFQQDEDGDTQLHIAVIQGFLEVVYSLIQMAPHPCYLDIFNNVCQTPLHLAVLTHQARIVRRLLVAGACVDLRDRDGNTALHLACACGDLEAVRALTEPVTVAEMGHASVQYRAYLQQLPQDLENRNYDGEMCVHVAAIGGHVDVLRHLVWFGANINARDAKGGRTPLHYSIERDCPRVTHYLLEECVPVLQLEATTYSGYTAYQLASCVDSVTARRLVDRGANAREIPEDSDSSDDEVSS